MKRLLQIGLVLLSLTVVFAPLLEFFDRWDPAGSLMNDTELATFGVVLLLGLVLLICKVVATLDRLGARRSVFRPQPDPFMAPLRPVLRIFVVVPHSSPPLRI